jgi:hypoxanthine phosphoribosyltransferase
VTLSRSSLAEIRYTPEQINQRVSELGRELREDLGDQRPLLVAVLKGSVIFLADLARRIGVDSEVDFMSVSSYSGGSRETGRVRILKDLEVSIEDRDVVIVEAIVDTGLTLSFLLKTLKTRGPRSLRVCTLLDKPLRRIAQPELHYRGFEIQDYVVGYGLDFKGRYRNLPYIVAVKDVPALAARPEALETVFGANFGDRLKASPMLR